jgi:hypothetical protein
MRPDARYLALAELAQQRIAVLLLAFSQHANDKVETLLWR